MTMTARGRISRFFFLAAVAPLLAITAGATIHKPFHVPEGGKIISPKEVRKYLKIASELSRYEAPYFRLPHAVVLDQEVFDARACGQIETTDGLSSVHCGIVGMWSPEDPEVVYISGYLKPEDRPQYLIHELVHWLQGQAGWAGDFSNCPDVAAHEAEAYTTQYLYKVLYMHTTDGFWAPDYLKCVSEQRHSSPYHGPHMLKPRIP